MLCHIFIVGIRCCHVVIATNTLTERYYESFINNFLGVPITCANTNCLIIPPFTRYNRLLNRLYNWLNNRLDEQSRIFLIFTPKTYPIGAWIGIFKPNYHNFKIAISPKLYIRSVKNLTTKLTPSTTRRGWSTTTVQEIEHGWRPPSWKLT